MEFAKPMLKDCKDLEDYKKYLSIAIIAWNLSLLPEGELEQKLEDLLGQLEEEDARHSHYSWM